jgi:hypothetical protein
MLLCLGDGLPDGGWRCGALLLVPRVPRQRIEIVLRDTPPWQLRDIPAMIRPLGGRRGAPARLDPPTCGLRWAQGANRRIPPLQDQLPHPVPVILLPLPLERVSQAILGLGDKTSRHPDGSDAPIVPVVRGTPWALKTPRTINVGKRLVFG